MMTEPQLHRLPDDEYFFEEGCFIKELLNRDDSPELSIAQARVQPGDTTRWHVLDGITERYVIQQGEGRVELGDRLSETVQPGDTVIIPPGCAQRITNTGQSDLVFLAICTPRFEPQFYRDGKV